MNDYIIIINIISNVLNGNSLNIVFNNKIRQNNNCNISKVKDISYGVIRYYDQLSIIIKYLIKINKFSQTINVVILIGLYELIYTKKANYAVVSFLVDIVYSITKQNNDKVFVNAVLRNFLRSKIEIDSKYANNLEYKYSLKKWWINKIIEEYPSNYLDILDNINEIPNICLRINKRKLSLENYAKELDLANIKYKIVENTIICNKNTQINKLPYFNDGYVSVQNISAQKILDMYDFFENSYVLDACCAPGGKLCAVLENHNVNIIGIDIDSSRIHKVKENLVRLDLSANINLGDVTNLEWWDKKMFDCIIADVPCSASGTIKKNPDIKIHRKPNDIQNIVLIQRAIVNNLLKTLKIGGKLLYITCSIFSEENESNIKYFIDNFRNVMILKDLKIIPDDYRDGFYYCLLEKIN
ncbi:MAG: 16S rRNA (cytosine(967)-C(5))-methyltransferase RsmB [Burkholderiales bacterium]|nr:16S rRNA (cytosine(967)-C(5))-methyltransferase RsmB [Burkholderiales bacterium]